MNIKIDKSRVRNTDLVDRATPAPSKKFEDRQIVNRPNEPVNERVDEVGSIEGQTSREGLADMPQEYAVNCIGRQARGSSHFDTACTVRVYTSKWFDEPSENIPNSHWLAIGAQWWRKIPCHNGADKHTSTEEGIYRSNQHRLENSNFEDETSNNRQGLVARKYGSSEIIEGKRQFGNACLNSPGSSVFTNWKPPYGTVRYVWSGMTSNHQCSAIWLVWSYRKLSLENAMIGLGWSWPKAADFVMICPNYNKVLAIQVSVYGRSDLKL